MFLPTIEMALPRNLLSPLNQTAEGCLFPKSSPRRCLLLLVWPTFSYLSLLRKLHLQAYFSVRCFQNLFTAFWSTPPNMPFSLSPAWLFPKQGKEATLRDMLCLLDESCFCTGHFPEKGNHYPRGVPASPRLAGAPDLLQISSLPTV